MSAAMKSNHGENQMSPCPKTIKSTVDALRSQYVVTERDQILGRLLNRLFLADEDGQPTHMPVLFTAGTETQAISFVDGSGSGKSTTTFEVMRNFKPLAHNPETGMPRWLHVKVESPATLRSLGALILKKLGVDKISDRAKVYEVWDMVRHRIALMGIQLLWLDEAHDLFGQTASVETNNMFKMLKGLMQGDHPIVLLLSGTQRLSQITSLDPQINRRFHKIMPKPLAFGVDNDNLRGIIAGYAEIAKLPADLDGDVINRLIHAGRHRFGRCIEIIIAAIECALHEGATSLRLQHFATAWAEKESCDIRQNVFMAANWAAIELEDKDTEISAEMAALAAKRNKKRA
jgi:hypothetical protein